MPFVKASEHTPPEGEPVHVHDAGSGRILTGRYAGGRWYVEDGPDGRLREISGVTHWGWILDSELNDDSDDD